MVLVAINGDIAYRRLRRKQKDLLRAGNCNRTLDSIVQDLNQHLYTLWTVYRVGKKEQPFLFKWNENTGKTIGFILLAILGWLDPTQKSQNVFLNGWFHYPVDDTSFGVETWRVWTIEERLYAHWMPFDFRKPSKKWILGVPTPVSRSVAKNIDKEIWGRFPYSFFRFRESSDTSIHFSEDLCETRWISGAIWFSLTQHNHKNSNLAYPYVQSLISSLHRSDLRTFSTQRKWIKF